MREHAEEEVEDEVVVDSEEDDDDEEISADSARLFARPTSNAGGCSGMDSTTGGDECIDESRLDEPDSIRVNYVGTKEPRNCSQADVFDVIEHLVALDSVELLRGGDSAKAVKEKSPCVLTVKGVHTLARRIGLTRLASDMARFEWVDGNRCKELEDGNSGSVRERKKINCMDEISEAGALGRESRYEAESKSQGGQSVEAGTGGSEIEFIRDLDMNLDVEASGLQLNAHLVDGATGDDCDVGFATQLAAEAMEALSHAPSSSSCSSFSPGIQTNVIPKPQSCFSSLDGSSSMKTRSCSESSRLTRRSKKRDGLLKSSGCLEKDSARSSSTIFRQYIRKRTAGVSRRAKQKEAALGSPSSSDCAVQLRTEKESKHNVKCNASGKGWLRSKAKLGQLKCGYPGENVNLDIVGKFGRAEEVVGETVLFDNSQRFKHQKLSSTSDSWCYPKRKRTRIDSRRLSSGAVDPPLSASQTLFKNKLNGNGSKREASPFQNSLGTLTVCLDNDEGVIAMEKAKRSCPRGARSVINLLPRDKTMTIGGVDRAKFLMKSEVEGYKDQPSPKSLDVGYIKNVTLAPIVSTGSGDLKMTQKDKTHPNIYWLRELNRLGVSNVGPDYKRKDLRKQRHMAYVRVLLSLHLEEVVIRQQKKMMLRLAIPMATSMDDATHFVADKFVRTRNMLEAIALGKPVVTPFWLESCLQAGYLIAEKNFILRDEKMEKKFAFDLPSSLVRARQYPLLEGKKVVITPNIGPDKEMILRLIEAVHGQAIETSDSTVIKDEISIEELLVVSCAEDRAVYSHFLKIGVAVYSSELLLNGIVTQKIDYKRYLLLGSERTQSD